MLKKPNVSSTRRKNPNCEPYRSNLHADTAGLKRAERMDCREFKTRCGRYGILTKWTTFVMPADQQELPYCYRQIPNGRYVKDFDATWARILGIVERHSLRPISMGV